MKELILFLFVAIFIACQNQQLPKSALETPIQPAAESQTTVQAPVSTEILAPMSLQTEAPKSFNLLAELQNSEKPGIYYREVILRSEISSIQSQAELVCLSDVTSFDESEIATTVPVPATAAKDSQIGDMPEDWAVLTEKWEWVQETLACENKPVENPACQGDMMPLEPGNLLSSTATDSFLAL